MIELRHLRYFIVVAEELHFSRAAKRLHIAQPGLSQQIKALEGMLGVRLLDRTKRQVRLTAAGQTLLDEGRRVLSDFDRVLDLARRTGSGLMGQLRVGAISSAAYGVLPNLLREYRTRYPDVELIFREMMTPIQVNAMRKGEIDIGFMRLPYDTGTLTTRTVRREELAVLLPEGHPLSGSDEVPLSALAREPLIVWPASPRPSWADYVIGLCRDAGFEPRIAQEANESATAIGFVAAGIGVALAPEGVKLLMRPGVEYRPIAAPAPVLRLSAVHNSRRTSVTVQKFLEILDEQWPDPDSGAD